MSGKKKIGVPRKSIDPETRSPLWLDIATVGSVIIGFAEVAVGTIGNSNALLANAFENLDNLTYGLDSVAARNEQNRKKNHVLRRVAGSIICAASLAVVANSVYDLQAHETPKLNSSGIELAAAATLLNASFAYGLSKHAHIGTTHRDAFRHSFADTISSAITVGAVIASKNGYPIVDSWTGIGLGVWTIAMTFPTNNRINSADQSFIDLTDNK